MHEWGDEWFVENGKNFNKAIYWCMKIWYTYGRIGTHGKEKFGTFRDNIYMWDGGLHTLLYPGYVRIVNPFLYFKLDKYVIKPFTRFTGLHKLGLKYQALVYNYAIQKVCKKYPYMIDEFISCLDGYEMVKPGIFGNVDGIKIHEKYWKTLI